MTNTKEPTALLKTKAAIKAFEAAQTKSAESGGRETEPDAAWHQWLNDAIAGTAPTPPRCGQGWDLFSSTMNCDKAANALFEKALDAIKAIESCPIKESAALREYLTDYCWRYN